MNFTIPSCWAAMASQYPELMTGRITLQEKGVYRIRTSLGEQNALVSGKFQFDAQAVSDYPVVGDYVMVNCADPDTVIIHQVLPRKSLFVRKAAGTSKTEQVVAANIDIAFLCMSLNNNFNLRRLERYLAVAWESGADPVVLLTKADLCGDVPRKLAEVEAIALGVPILVTSAMESDGYRQIMPSFYYNNAIKPQKNRFWGLSQILCKHCKFQPLSTTCTEKQLHFHGDSAPLSRA